MSATPITCGLQPCTPRPWFSYDALRRHYEQWHHLDPVDARAKVGQLPIRHTPSTTKGPPLCTECKRPHPPRHHPGRYPARCAQCVSSVA